MVEQVVLGQEGHVARGGELVESGVWYALMQQPDLVQGEGDVPFAGQHLGGGLDLAIVIGEVEFEEVVDGLDDGLGVHEVGGVEAEMVEEGGEIVGQAREGEEAPLAWMAPRPGIWWMMSWLRNAKRPPKKTNMIGCFLAEYKRVHVIE